MPLTPFQREVAGLLAANRAPDSYLAGGAALEGAESFVRSRPPEELGCLYYSPSGRRFVAPGDGTPSDAVVHFGRPGGVLPELYAGDTLQP